MRFILEVHDYPDSLTQDVAIVAAWLFHSPLRPESIGVLTNLAYFLQFVFIDDFDFPPVRNDEFLGGKIG